MERLRSDGTSQAYYSVGQAAPAIAATLGWSQHNIWLGEIERRYILARRGWLFPNLERTIAYLLQQPHSVHEDTRRPGAVYFLVSGVALRRAELMESSTIPWLDAVVERRLVRGGRYLELSHFAPTDRNKGGRQRWP